MKTQYYTAASLDSFIATEDDSLEWLFPLGNAADTGYAGFAAQVGALAMGSATYEWMLRHVAGPGAPQPAAWPYAQPAWVFSSRALLPRRITGPHALRLVSARRIGPGFAELRYEVPRGGAAG